jgi:hypothetical protein
LSRIIWLAGERSRLKKVIDAGPVFDALENALGVGYRPRRGWSPGVFDGRDARIAMLASKIEEDYENKREENENDALKRRISLRSFAASSCG